MQSAQSMAVLKKVLDGQKQAGQAALQLLQAAAPQAQEPGKGSLVDVTS